MNTVPVYKDIDLYNIDGATLPEVMDFFRNLCEEYDGKDARISVALEMDSSVAISYRREETAAEEQYRKDREDQVVEYRRAQYEKLKLEFGNS